MYFLKSVFFFIKLEEYVLDNNVFKNFQLLENIGKNCQQLFKVIKLSMFD